jgi:ketosteroid isomerase-like protein
VTAIEQLHRCYTAINDGEVHQLEELLAPDFVYCARTELPGGGTYRGRDVCLERLRELRELFDQLHWEPQDVVEVGARILVVARLTGVGRTSGASIDEPLIHVWTTGDRHAVELRVFSERSEALLAPGSSADQ